MVGSKNKSSTRKRNRKDGFVTLNFQGSITMGAATSGLFVKDDLFASVLPRSLFAISADVLFTTRGFTPTEGPVLVGFSHSDLTVTEISEKIAADGSLAVLDGDLITLERMRRPVRRVGTFPIQAEDEVLSHGEFVRQTLKFVCQTGKTISAWGANFSGATLTTGGVIQYEGNLYARRM